MSILAESLTYGEISKLRIVTSSIYNNYA